MDREIERPAISVLIPTYGAAEMLERCLESLALYTSPNSTVYVLDDATPGDSIRQTCELARKQLPGLRYWRSPVNRGFVGICNWGCEQLGEPATDVLLLNSDTEVTAGFLEEMQAVLYLHEKHAVVTPRSNNATIFSVPFLGGRLPANESFEVWKRLRDLLPRYQVMPTAVGFCMLIKREVLQRFDLFDDVYSPGYNEENDFVCRINRCGYSAVAANRAYVFHHESSSFGPRRAKLEARNGGILIERYPEYRRKVADYIAFQMEPLETFAGLYHPHRPRVLYDLFHLPAKHSGTSDFALNLLREIAPLLADDYELHVGIQESQTFFANELAGYRIYRDRPTAQMQFDLVYKPCQVFTWAEFRRMNRLAPRVSYTLQDIIGVRCGYLNAPDREILFRKTAELSDHVFTISEFSRSDFAAFYRSEVPMPVIYHGTNFGATPGEFRSGEYVLVMGNAFAHKGVTDAVRHLGGTWPVVVLGGEAGVPSDNVRWLASGNLTRQYVRELLVNARVLVYPSHYEGFGLPVIDALALGKPVVVRDTAVSREVAEAVQSENLYRVGSLKYLHSTVQRLFDQRANPPRTPPRRWHTAAEEYVAAFREILTSDVDLSKLRARWDLLRTLESVSPS